MDHSYFWSGVRLSSTLIFPRNHHPLRCVQKGYGEGEVGRKGVVNSQNGDSFSKYQAINLCWNNPTLIRQRFWPLAKCLANLSPLHSTSFSPPLPTTDSPFFGVRESSLHFPPFPSITSIKQGHTSDATTHKLSSKKKGSRGSPGMH